MLPEVTKLTKHFLVLPKTIAKSEQSFSVMNRIKTYLRYTTSGNRLKQYMLLHAHFKKTDQRNLIQAAKDFVGHNHARQQTFGRF